MGRRKKTPQKSLAEQIADKQDTMSEVLAEDLDADKPAAEDDAPPPPSGTAPKGTRYLKCRMTPIERGGATKKLLRVIERMRQRELTMNALREQVGDERKALAAEMIEMRTLAVSRRDGTAYRYVPCEERREPEHVLAPEDEAAGAEAGPLGVATYRLDTNERIEWRRLNRSELQGDLFDDLPSQAAG